MTTPQDALVEVLAEEFCRRRPQGRVHSLLDGYPCKACTLDAREFIGRHRIVRLPEEDAYLRDRDRSDLALAVRMMNRAHVEAVEKRNANWGGMTAIEQDFHNLWPAIRPSLPGNPIDATTDHSQPTQKDGEG